MEVKVEVAQMSEPDKAPTDTWQCNRCGEEFGYERGKRPAFCQVPGCKGKRFAALTGPWAFFDGEKFVPAKMARKISENRRFATHKQSHVIFVYKNGSYSPDGEELIRSEVRTELGDLCKENYPYEVVKDIEERTYTDSEKFEAPVNLINVKNGILDAETGKLAKHTPDIIFTNELPVEYDLAAECPAIMKFLGEILEEDDIALIQEIAGYCLWRDYQLAKAIMLLGPGANAKSTLLRLIASILGEKNVATPALQDLVYNRFAKSELFGKLANIHADIPAVPLKHTGVFKMLTGQDLIWAEQKHKNPFTFRNYAKLLYSANELPAVGDTSEAFWRRWIIIKFSKVFAEDDPKTDPHIIKNLTTQKELSGFLNFALEGLKRLLKNGRFTTTRTGRETEEEWIARTDSLRAFAAKHVILDPKYFTTKDDFFTAYLEFCEIQDVSPVEKSAVGKRLPMLLRATEFHPSIRGRQVRAWRGVRFSKEFEKYHMTDITVPLENFVKQEEDD